MVLAMIAEMVASNQESQVGMLLERDRCSSG